MHDPTDTTSYMPRLDANGNPVTTDAYDPHSGTMIEWPRYMPEEVDAATDRRADFQRAAPDERLLRAILDGLRRLEGDQK